MSLIVFGLLVCASELAHLTHYYNVDECINSEDEDEVFGYYNVYDDVNYEYLLISIGIYSLLVSWKLYNINA